MRGRAGAWLAAAAGAAVLLAVAPPVLQAAGHPEAAWLIRLLLSPLCHQDPLRSVAVWGSPAALCARCLAVHAGVLLGALALAVGANAPPRGALTAGAARRLLAIGAIPMGLQWLAARLLPGLPALDANLPRAATGLILGSTLAILLAGALEAILSPPPSPAIRPLRRHPSRSRPQGDMHAAAAD
jgi:uncharacterized membrane protein